MQKFIERYDRFYMKDETIQKMKPNFGYWPLGEIIFYDKYSRLTEDKQETWADTVTRNINGVFTIRKNHYAKNCIPWNENRMQDLAAKMAVSMFNMEWLPPGRGLWMMGTEFMYERGGMCLYNCAFKVIEDHTWIEDICWIMDALMYGVGVGFWPKRGDITLINPSSTFEHVVKDSREGWVEAIRLLLRGFQNGRLPIFDYSEVRPYGTPIKGFGGTASGPRPLAKLIERATGRCYAYLNREIDIVEFKTDLANMVGCCVVAGNVRRSAEIAIGNIDDPVFIDLKNQEYFPERNAYDGSGWGWMSNNSVILEKDSDFEMMDEIAHRVKSRGEPGYINRKTMRRGRIGDTKYKLRDDKAIGFNPCGEIPLEDGEVCNLVETLPTRCTTVETWLQACEYATFYASTVALYPTHSPITNAVVARNRRIGVGIIDYIGWKGLYGVNKIIRYLRQGYNRVREVNAVLNDEAGVPHAIRVTTVKPGGTTPKLAGRKSGMGHANFQYMLRRIIIPRYSAMEKVLMDAGVPNELSVTQPDESRIFEIPIFTGHDKPAKEVSLWEQAMNLVLLQREWADNAVSNTLNFGPHETDSIEAVLSAIAPHTKSVALLPHTDDGVYAQMPESALTKEEYFERLNAIKPLDWSQYRVDATGEKYCDGGRCEIPKL